jgi:hypothetical protein
MDAMTDLLKDDSRRPIVAVRNQAPTFALPQGEPGKDLSDLVGRNWVALSMRQRVLWKKLAHLQETEPLELELRRAIRLSAPSTLLPHPFRLKLILLSQAAECRHLKPGELKLGWHGAAEGEIANAKSCPANGYTFFSSSEFRANFAESQRSTLEGMAKDLFTVLDKGNSQFETAP